MERVKSVKQEVYKNKDRGDFYIRHMFIGDRRHDAASWALADIIDGEVRRKQPSD